MTWVRFDDTCPDHPKIAGLSDAAHRLWFDAMCYCNRMLTDGAIPRGMVAKLQPRKPSVAAQELVDAGLWDATDSGYAVHDYLEFQPSRANVLSERAEKHEQKVRAGKAGAVARWKQGDSSRIAEVVADGKQNDSPVPDPTRTQHPIPLPEIPPVVPPLGGASPAMRARNGSKRQRDVIALRSEQTTEERYLGKYAGGSR